MSTLKRKIAMSDNKTFAAIKRLKAMRVVVPSKRFVKTRSNKIEGVIRGVAMGGPTGPERKKFDTFTGSTSLTATTPFIQSCTAGIVEGLASNQRVGSRIQVKGLDFEANVLLAVTEPSSFAVYGDLMVVWDKQPDGNIPSVATILTSSSTNLTFGNTSNLERFQILRRENICLDGAQGVSKITKFHVPLDLGVRFPDTTGSPNTHDVYIVFVTPNGTANVFSFNYVSRITYTDE